MKQRPASIDYHYTRWLFLRVLAVVYLFAFASLATQIVGLVGKQGILPAANFLAQITAQAPAIPTIFWLNSSDFALSAACFAGIAFAVLAFFGITSVFSFAALWLLYLSLVNIGQDFLSFQWDILLLETGFLAIFLTPWQWLEWRTWKRAGQAPPLQSLSKIEAPLIMIWLLRWLLFRLMFESGFVKLASGDPTWRNLSALNYHYFTQPLPTPIAWYAAQLPDWFNQFSVMMVFAIELGVPFLIFCGRRARLIAVFILIPFQILIAITGNYAFFNLLTIALCICLLDDQWIDSGKLAWQFVGVALATRGRLPLQEEPAIVISNDKKLLPLLKAQHMVSIAVAVLIGVLSIRAIARAIVSLPMPAFVEQLADISERYFIYNSYGLFAVMTTKRLEIQIEGSNDGLFWNEYEFKYKPGDLAQAPLIVAPLQPRLDWQMWFAALSDFRNNPWFLNLVIRLLQSEPTVLKLLAHNPFPSQPPQYIRARLYDYSFTNCSERNKTGTWWRRKLVGDYLPIITLQDNAP